MRALCGAIITAAALIGLGLTAIGFGVRYSNVPTTQINAQGQQVRVELGEMDRPLVYCLVLSTAGLVIGLGISFLGLMYHHYKRHHEFLKEHGHPPHGPWSPTGTTTMRT